MVCISCIVIPVLLYIWHKFLQPIVLKFWNPWGTVEDKTGEKTADGDQKEANSSLKCPFTGDKSNASPQAEATSGHAKSD